MKTAHKRTVAPRELSVGDIQDALDKYLNECGTRDMSELLADLKKDANWKTAPKCSLMSKYHGLYTHLVRICPAGVMPPKRTTLALIALHQARPCNFTGRRDSDWADELSLAIRAGMSKFRELLDSTAYSRCVAKASKHEKDAIDMVLSQMKTGGESLASDGEACLALVPHGHCAGSSSAATTAQSPWSFGNFDRFLVDFDSELAAFSAAQAVHTPQRGLSKASSAASLSVASTSFYSPEEPDR